MSSLKDAAETDEVALYDFLAEKREEALHFLGSSYFSSLIDELEVRRLRGMGDASKVREAELAESEYGNYGENFSNYAENFSNYAENFSNYAENFSNYAENFSNYAQSMEPSSRILGRGRNLAELRRKSQKNAGIPGRLPNGKPIPPASSGG